MIERKPDVAICYPMIDRGAGLESRGNDGVVLSVMSSVVRYGVIWWLGHGFDGK